MKTSVEVQVLQWFERALAQKPEFRKLWLADQDMDQEVRERVLRLLDADQASSGFLEETAVAEEPLPPEFPKVGERLGAWELLKPLESGGMGVVYLGRRADDVYDQQVAIKLVRPVHLLAAAEFRRQLISRFEDERSILARMSHPNVARILDGGSTGAGIPYLVMEFVDGVPLTDYCKANKLDVRQRLALFAKVCDGVQEAHRHLIVHRDLKPDNVLVGDNGEPRLLDFGIAKILEQEPLSTDGKRHTSLSAMTPAYASPEQVRQQALTTSSDVYSLGVMLYQLLAGVRPYELGGLRPAEAEAVVCDTLPDPMRKKLEKAALTDGERKARRAQITADVERIVAKAMHKESARRYGSAQELADDIRRYLAGQPVLAHPDSAGYRVRKFVRRHRLGVAAAAVALVAVLASAGVALWQAGEARQAADDMAQANRFLLNVLSYSDPYFAGGDPTISEAVDASLPQLDARFGDRPDIAAGIRHVIGYSMTSRGRLEDAGPQLEKALQEAEAAYGPGSLLAYQIREALAQLALAKGETKSGQSQLLELLQDIEGSEHVQSGFHFLVLNNLGQVYMNQELYDRAREQFSEAEKIPDSALDGMSPDSKAVLVSNQAFVAHGLGELERADALYKAAWEAHQQVYPEGSLEQATLLSNHAYLMQETGRADAARDFRRRSLALREKLLGPDHPALIQSYLGMASEAGSRKDYAQSLEILQRADALARRSLAAPHEDRVLVRFMLASALARTGSLDEAQERTREAEEELADLPEAPEFLLQVRDFVLRTLCEDPGADTFPRCRTVPSDS